jgi:ribosomal protein S18 acetylase RimI-like enzyme
MNRESICLRAARPTFEEGLVFGRLYDEVTEHGFRYLFGRHVVDILAAAYIVEGHDLSFENAMFAERDGEIIGMISGYTAEQHRDSTDKPLMEAPGNRMLRRWGVALLAARRRLFGALQEGDFYVQAFIVDEDFRGQGVGTVLMKEMEAQARETGSTRFTLDVTAKNIDAQKLYERSGLIVESKWPDMPLIPPILLRMVKPL